MFPDNNPICKAVTSEGFAVGAFSKPAIPLQATDGDLPESGEDALTKQLAKWWKARNLLPKSKSHTGWVEF